MSPPLASQMGLRANEDDLRVSASSRVLSHELSKSTVATGETSVGLGLAGKGYMSPSIVREARKVADQRTEGPPGVPISFPRKLFSSMLLSDCFSGLSPV